MASIIPIKIKEMISQRMPLARKRHADILKPHKQRADGLKLKPLFVDEDRLLYLFQSTASSASVFARNREIGIEEPKFVRQIDFTPTWGMAGKQRIIFGSRSLKPTP